MTIIAKNETAGALALSQLPVPNGQIPAGVGSTVSLSDFASVAEIQSDDELRAHIAAGDCVLNDGASDLSQAESLALVEPVTSTTGGPALTGDLADAKGDLLVGSAADAFARLPVGADALVLTADSAEPTGIKWAAGGGGGGSPVFGDYYGSPSTAIAGTATTLTLDTTRQSNALFVLATNAVTIQAGGAGDYFVRYDVTTDEASTGGQGADYWLEIGGVEVTASRCKGEHYTSGTDNTSGRSMLLSLSDGDVLRLRGQVTTGTPPLDTLAGGVSLLFMSPGATGPAGPTGAGSSVIVQDDGVTVTGGPHSTLNFLGSVATDAGGGVAEIASLFGSEYQSTTDRTFRQTTSTSFFEVHKLTTSGLPAGTYRVEWAYVWSYDDTQNNFECRVQVDNSTELYGQTSGGAGAYDAHQQEAKDKGGSGDGGTDQRHVASFFADVVLSAGVHEVDVDIATSSSGKRANVHLTTVAVYRIS